MDMMKRTSRRNGRAERSSVGGTWESPLNVNKAAGQGEIERKILYKCACLNEAGYHWNNIVIIKAIKRCH